MKVIDIDKSVIFFEKGKLPFPLKLDISIRAAKYQLTVSQQMRMTFSKYLQNIPACGNAPFCLAVFLNFNPTFILKKAINAESDTMLLFFFFC